MITNRLKILITRRVTWTLSETGEEWVGRVSFREAWMYVGIHSFRWKWVRKYGRLDCGCTRNPITRRMVLFAGECADHGISLEDLEESE